MNFPKCALDLEKFFLNSQFVGVLRVMFYSGYFKSCIHSNKKITAQPLELRTNFCCTGDKLAEASAAQIT